MLIDACMCGVPSKAGDGAGARRICVLDADAARRFAALSTFRLTEGLVKDYPEGSFLAPAFDPATQAAAGAGGPPVTHVLLTPLNGITDEVYTIYYPLLAE